MSGWDAYISNLMQSSKAIKRAAILGASDGGVWARDADFSASADECKKMSGLFSNYANVPATGFDLEGKHYVCPRAEEFLLFGKKENEGVFAKKTKSAVVIAVFEGGTTEGQEARTAVEKMGDYLEKSGY